MTRREFITNGIASAGSACLASPVRSNMGGFLQQYMETVSEEQYTASDYVQDGLVSMWDGIENVGFGLHDSETRIWKDLIGDNDLYVQGSSYFQNKCFVNVYMGGCSSIGDPRPTVATAEICVDVTDTSSWFTICTYRQTVGNMRWIGIRANDTINFGNGGDCMQGQRRGINCYTGAYDILTQSISMYMNGQPMKNLGPGLGGLGESALGIPGHYPPFSVYAIRFYSRALNNEEVAYNHIIDQERFMK